jgi:hypothetical protein
VPTLVEMLWRDVGPSGKPIECGVCETVAGLEVHCHLASPSMRWFGRSALLTSTSRDIAAAWKQAAI